MSSWPFQPLLPAGQLLGSPPPVKLYLRNTTANGISIGGVACYDWLDTPGSETDTAVVNATASGSNILFTKTAGGSVVRFITKRIAAGGWVITGQQIFLWMQESTLTVNAGARVRLYKWSAGTTTELTGSPTDNGVELSDVNALQQWASSITGTPSEDDRLVLEVLINNVGTMGAGTATLGFNGAIGGSIAQITVYPDPATGNPRFPNFNATSWAAARAGTSSAGGVEYPAAADLLKGEFTAGAWNITRSGFILDTSGIPDTAIVLGAILWVKMGNNYQDDEPTNPALGALVGYTPSSDTAPVSADYSQFGLVKYSDDLMPITSALDTYFGYNLNPAGLAAINKGGNTRLGIRPNNDFSDATAPNSANRSNKRCYYAAQAGTDSDPKLVIYYTTVSYADSYINVYPAITFKEEGGGGVTLTLSDSTHGHTADAVVLSTSSLLAVQDALHAHAADNVVLTAQSSLAVDEALHSHATDNLALTSATALVIAEAASAHLADSPVLTVASVLAVAEAVHGHIADNIGLSSETALAIAEALHAHAADNITLSVAASVDLVIAEALHAQAADNLALTLQSLLAVQDALHSHAADNADLSTQLSLAVAEALHSHLADNLTLSITTGLSLVIAEALHAHTADSIELTSETALVIAEAASAHLADSPTLTVASVLAVAEALHALSSDNLALNTGAALLVNDTLHAHAADNLAFTLQSSLEVAEALHAQLADNVTLSIAETLAIIDALHGHAADNVGLTFVEILYVFGQRGAYSNTDNSTRAAAVESVRAAAQNIASRMNQQTNTRNGSRSTSRRR